MPPDLLPSLRISGRKGLLGAALPGMLERGCRLPIFFHFGFGGYECPEFRAAREAAERYAGVLAREGGPQTVAPVMRRLSLGEEQPSALSRDPGEGCEPKTPK